MNRRGCVQQSCSVVGCLDVVAANGLCNVHYVRVRRGTPMTRPWDVAVEGPKCAGIAERREAIWRWELSDGAVTFEPNTGCWLWLGWIDPSGYGRIGSHRAPWGGYAHRAALYFCGEQLEAGLAMHVRHLCDNPACVNPAHLRYGTAKENMADRTARARRECWEGAARRKRDPRAGDRIRVRIPAPPRPRGHKLTADAVKSIRAALSAGESQSSLSRRFGVAQPTISRIASREIWRNAEAA